MMLLARCGRFERQEGIKNMGVFWCRGDIDRGGTMLGFHDWKS